MIKTIIFVISVSLGMMSNASAALKSYDISWVGSNNYSLSGRFSFDDATSGPSVDKTELTSFFIEGFLNGTSLGTYSGPTYNFSFNALTGKLGGGAGGFSSSSNGQIWNVGVSGASAIGIGLGSGTFSQALYLNGVRYLDSKVDFEFSNSTLQATPSAVPLPAAAWMFVAGLAALFGGKWRLKRNVPIVA